MERLEEVKRWLAQALRDFKAAKDSLAAGNYEWAAFQAQQAAEKGVKALLHGHGLSAWGHSVLELFEVAREEYGLEVEEFLTKARELDRHYMPARYPNVYESGYPGLYYDEEAAGRAIDCAEAILNWVKGKLKGLGLEM